MRKSQRRKIERATAGEPSIVPEAMPPALNWAVMWLARDKKGKVKIVEKWCGDDFSEALRVYELARKAQKTGATLRCANYAFPPPKSITERERIVSKVVIKKRGGVRKRVRVRRTEVFNAMSELNAQGILWCPYCIKLRSFEKQDGFIFEGLFVPKVAYYCPMCGISHSHGIIRKYNPLSYKMDPPRRMRRGKGK